MKYTSEEIANILNGTIEGESSKIVSSIAKIEEGKNGDLCFLSNPKYTPYLYTTKASVVIINKDLILDNKVDCTLIRVEDAYIAFSKLLELYNKMTLPQSEISKKSDISKSAKIGKNCYIGPFVYIGENVIIEDNTYVFPHSFIDNNVTIGTRTTIFAGVKIYNNCKIGKDNIIHAGAVIGADGFGFAPNSNGNYNKIQQIGNVVTKEFVEIGSNTTIDRATLGSTLIKKEVK